MAHGGTLTVTTRAEGDEIVIDITDTGSGIREEHLDRIFDSFFTTKGEVKGVGLGLCVCYGFIQDHGGDIKVKSREGTGTTFTITLPVHAPDESVKDAQA
jgi:two-component system NtrC family sensor kinase